MEKLSLYRTLRHYAWRLINKPFPAGPHITRYVADHHMGHRSEVT